MAINSSDAPLVGRRKNSEDAMRSQVLMPCNLNYLVGIRIHSPEVTPKTADSITESFLD